MESTVEISGKESRLGNFSQYYCDRSVLFFLKHFSRMNLKVERNRVAVVFKAGYFYGCINRCLMIAPFSLQSST
jgi:hypothetical protein